jgi:hypothetical protein
MNFVTLASHDTWGVVTMITSQAKVLSYHTWHLEDDFIPFAIKIFECLHQKVDDLFFQCVNMAWSMKGFRGLFLLKGRRRALEDYFFWFCVHFIDKGCLWLFRISESSNHRCFMMCSCSRKKNLLWVFHPSPYTTCFVLLLMGLGPRLFDFSS